MIGVYVEIPPAPTGDLALTLLLEGCEAIEDRLYQTRSARRRTDLQERLVTMRAQIDRLRASA